MIMKLKAEGRRQKVEILAEILAVPSAFCFSHDEGGQS